MKTVAIGLGLSLAAQAAVAGGIERTTQSTAILFEKGSYAELSFGHVDPSVSGTDVAAQPTGNVAGSYLSFGLAYKQDLGDRMALAVILDKPFGADIEYGPSSPLLGGTIARADTAAVTALLKYQMDRFSVFGGIRAQKASAHVHLQGLAYGPINGYDVNLDDDIGFGYVVGAAYEIPDIALRVALTYNSSITHDFDTHENIAPGVTSTTEVKSPQSVNLDFQTGVAANTLVFGQIRWVKWSEFRIDPAVFTGATGDGLVNLDDTIAYSIGVGRKFSDTWSGSASILYEPKTGDDLVSPLAPTNGRKGITLAAIYTKGNMKVTTGVNYTWLGDAMPETGTPDTARADFSDNHVLGVGVKVGWTF